MKENENLAFFFWGAFRFVIYALAVVLLAEFIKWDAGQSPAGDKFSESSYTEYMQAAVLFCSSALLFRVYRRYPGLRFTALLLFGLTAASFIREQDVYFETYFGDGTWLYPVLAVLAFVLYKVLRNFQAFLQECRVYFSSVSFGLFTMGFLTTYVFSRLFGRTIFWKEVMGDQYIRPVKNAAEECLELYGYLLIGIAVIELWRLAVSMNVKTKPVNEFL